MKKLTSIMLVLALILGFVPNFAPVNAVAATTLSVSVQTNTVGAIRDKIIEEVGSQAKSTFSNITLNLSSPCTEISATDWMYIREVFSSSEWSSLATLTINSTSVTRIGNVDASETKTPKWSSVTLPENLTVIGTHAFRNSKQLTTITIPKNVTDIGALAFAGCERLTSFTAATGGNGNYTSDSDGVLYTRGMATLICYPAGRSGENYTIKIGITTLGIGSFADVKIKKLTIPTGVKTINNAFAQTTDTPYALTEIWFNSATPPGFSTTGAFNTFQCKTTTYNGISIYVPGPSMNSYKNLTVYKNAFGDRIKLNDGGDAEIIGLKIKGFVGIGDFNDSNNDTYKDGSETEVDDDEEETPEDYESAYYSGEAYIDLESESLTVNVSVGTASSMTSFKVEGYSANGGVNWVAGELTAAKLATVLNSTSGIKLSNRFDTTSKKPKIDSDIITFPTIQARPSGNIHKLKLFYDDEHWGLVKAYTDASFSSLMDDLQIVKADGSKLPANPNWNGAGSLSIDDSGVDIDDLPAKGEKKPSYYLRVTAFRNEETDKIYPNGKPWKVTPATRSKAPNYKANYKKELIKIKKGDSFDDTAFTVKKDANITEYLDDKIKSVEIVKLATGKKPGSMPQTFTFAQRADMQAYTFTVEKGKIKDRSLKLYEFSTNGKTWGKAPKFTKSTTLYVRLKQNVKVKKGEILGNAASNPGTLTIEWGKYDEEKNKSGVLSATISPTPPVDAGSEQTVTEASGTSEITE